MTLWARALLGILVGSVLTLFVHPIARQFLFSALRLSSPNAIFALANVTPRSLPAPTNPVAAGVWLQMACDKIAQGNALSKKESETLVGLAKEGASFEPQNAFWNQMAAVFEFHEGRAAAASQDWVKASHCLSWNDMQSGRLLQMRAQLAQSGLNQAWTYGYVYFERSEAPAKAIEKYAQNLITKADLNELEGLKLRYATICNGSLLRDGSRSLRVGYRGAGIIELATYPPSLYSHVTGYKRIWIAQTTMTSKLRESGLTEEASHADETFRKNEAWLALVQRESTEDNLRNMCIMAITVATLPGSLMLCAICGATLLIVLKLRSNHAPPERFHPAILIPLGALGALAVFWATRNVLAAAALGFAVLFLLFNPPARRRSERQSWGPLFSFTVLMIWFLTTCASTVFLISTSAAGMSLLPSLGPAGEYLSESQVFLAIAVFMGSLIFLVPPAWGIIARQTTPIVFRKTMQTFGMYLAIGSLVLCALSGPFAVFEDRQCAQELKNLVENEPNYYLLK